MIHEKISPYAIPGLRRVDMPMTLKKTIYSDIVNATCEYFGLTRESLASRTRFRDIVYPRQCAIYLICMNTKISLKQIGCLMGMIDHTTVMHSREVIKRRLAVNDGDVRTDIDSIYLLATNGETIKEIVDNPVKLY